MIANSNMQWAKNIMLRNSKTRSKLNFFSMIMQEGPVLTACRRSSASVVWQSHAISTSTDCLERLWAGRKRASNSDLCRILSIEAIDNR